MKPLFQACSSSSKRMVFCLIAEGCFAGWLRCSCTMLETPAVVTGLNDVAVVREAIEQRGRHLGVAKHVGPFGEVEVGRHDDGGAFVEAADQVEQQLATRLCKRQVAELVEDHEIDPHQPVGDAALTVELSLGFELVGEVDGVEKACLLTGSDDIPRNGYGDVRLPRAGSTDEDNIALIVEENPGRELSNQLAVDRRALEGEIGQFLGKRQFGNPQLIVD